MTAPPPDTGLRLHEGETWYTTGHALPTADCPDHRVPQATLALRRIGWVDQKGRVYQAIPPQAGFDGGSLTPLLINPGCD